MKTKIALGILTVTVLLCGCHKSAPGADAAKPAKWDYDSFCFKGEWTNFSGKKYVTKVLVLQGPGYWTNTCYTTAEVLDWIGKWGWRLRWSDGSNCIVERPDVWTNGAFIVAQMPE